MTQFTQKRFTVKTGARRDCDSLNHWPRPSKKGYVCVFCGKPCDVEGKGVEDGK